jgi:hypothetical protein
MRTALAACRATEACGQNLFVPSKGRACLNALIIGVKAALLVVSETGEAYYARNVAPDRESGGRGHSMKLALALMVSAFLVGGAALWAQRGAATAPVDPAVEYQTWMKSNNEAMADLNKNLTAKNAAGAQTDIRKVQENLAMAMCYWQIRNVNDAVRFALDGTYGLAQVGVLVSQNKFDDAAAALKPVQANCAGCHMAHRDRAADGSFKIK